MSRPRLVTWSVARGGQQSHEHLSSRYPPQGNIMQHRASGRFSSENVVGCIAYPPNFVGRPMGPVGGFLASFECYHTYLVKCDNTGPGGGMQPAPTHFAIAMDLPLSQLGELDIRGTP